MSKSLIEFFQFKNRPKTPIFVTNYNFKKNQNTHSYEKTQNPSKPTYMALSFCDRFCD